VGADIEGRVSGSQVLTDQKNLLFCPFSVPEQRQSNRVIVVKMGELAVPRFIYFQHLGNPQVKPAAAWLAQQARCETKTQYHEVAGDPNDYRSRSLEILVDRRVVICLWLCFGRW
jgi:hypothetical protein